MKEGNDCKEVLETYEVAVKFTRTEWVTVSGYSSDDAKRKAIQKVSPLGEVVNWTLLNSEEL